MDEIDDAWFEKFKLAPNDDASLIAASNIACCTVDDNSAVEVDACRTAVIEEIQRRRSEYDKKQPRNDVEAKSLNQLGLRWSIANALDRAGIVTVRDLLNCSEADVLAVRGIGATYMTMIRECLNRNGLALRVEGDRA